MKKILVMILALIMALGMIPAMAEEDITIAMIGQQLGNVVFLPAEQGMKDAGEKLGIKTEWQSPMQAVAEEQNDIMLNLIARGDVDGIAISCTTGDALMASINAAIEAGIKVVCYDVDSPNSNREYYIGTENYKAGYTCGEYMIDLYKDSGLEKVRVAILAGIPGADDIEARIRGFEEAIAGSNIEVVYEFACNDNVDEAVEGVEAYCNANGGDIEAWFMAGGWPYTVDVTAMPNTNAWKLADPLHKIVTVDIFPETTPAFFDAGVLDVAVGQNFYNMGYYCVETLVKLIKGEAVEAPFDETLNALFINTGVQIATIEDYKEVMGL
jgi:ribose transport system substrate-binding protein